MLSQPSARARLLATLVPRVRAGWPAIAAIALAVVLAHSGVRHLDASPDLTNHYRSVVGSDGWTRFIGILQLLAAGGLVFRRTRVTTAAAFAAVVLIALANQVRTDREGLAVATSIALLAWALVVAWGEARRRKRLMPAD